MADKKKFGLVMPKKAGASKVLKHSVFDEDESDEDNKSRKRPKIPQKKLDLKSKVKPELVEDPSIYEYDNIYEEMKLAQVESIAPKEKKNSRYIETLMKAADKRKKEYERRLDKKIQVEREKEGDKFKDKEAFVTSSYKKKMEELEEEEERERRENAMNEMMDVTKQKDLSGFYRHFLKQTVGEEKVPEFGERRIKKEIVSDDNSPQNLTESPKDYKDIDRDSDGIEIDSDSDENRGHKKHTTKDRRKSYTHSHSSGDRAGSFEKHKNTDQDSDSIEIDSDEEENRGNEKHFAEDKGKKTYPHSQGLAGSSKEYKNIDQDSDGVEIDSNEEVSQGNDKYSIEDKERKSYRESSSKSGDLNKNSSRQKVIEMESISSRKTKTLSSQKHIRAHHKKSSESSNSNSSSSDDEPDDSIRKKKNPNKHVQSNKNNTEDSRHDTHSSSSDDDNDKNEVADDDANGKKLPSEKSQRKNIYAKRTVGDIFAQAQARYFQRMALRDS